MRRLILMRHAKSSWRSGATRDHDRPLNGRGRRDSPKVAARLVELGWEPHGLLSSDSRRTTETFERMRPVLPEVAFVRFEGALYHGGHFDIVEAASTVPATVTTLLVLGHNPGWEQALLRLTGMAQPMKTACCALLEREDTSAGSWGELLAVERSWRFVEMIRPREL